MTRQRLRDAHSPADLATIYAKPHRSNAWPEHRLRVAVMIDMARSIAQTHATVADLSCGDGVVLANVPAGRRIRGDFAPGWEHTGPLEQTLDRLDPVDLYVCGETLEHLDDPDAALAKIRSKTRWLLLSTPVDAWNETNIEHYWAWSREDVEEMLRAAGFGVVLFAMLDFRPNGSEYAFGIWVAT